VIRTAASSGRWRRSLLWSPQGVTSTSLTMKLCALVLTATVSATLSFAGPVERRQMGGVSVSSYLPESR